MIKTGARRDLRSKGFAEPSLLASRENSLSNSAQRPLFGLRQSTLHRYRGLSPHLDRRPSRLSENQCLSATAQNVERDVEARRFGSAKNRSACTIAELHLIIMIDSLS